MTSVDETLPEDKEKEPVNDEVETNEEIQIENTEKPPIENPEEVSQTPTEFCEEVKEKTKERVQKLFECPKCHKMLTKKTLNYYHECTKNDVPKAKRRPKKIVVENIEPSGDINDPPPMPVKLTRQTNQIVEQGEKFLKSIEGIEDIEDLKPVQKSYEELRKERLQQRILQRHDKIQQLFKSAI